MLNAHVYVVVYVCVFVCGFVIRISMTVSHKQPHTNRNKIDLIVCGNRLKRYMLSKRFFLGEQ